ncbi:MAG TPA: hypothetical protein DEP65_05860 [Ruminococcus sp.]|nr:hypothetical protein [Ruminococcus sp.]
MELSQRVSYLKGLMDGLKIDDSTDQGKVLRIMADILDDMALSIEDIADEVDEAVEIIDDIDSDLGDLEEAVYFDDDADYEDLDDYEEIDDDDDYDPAEDFEGDFMYECICPSCGETIRLGESIVEEGSIDCPNCGEKIEFDYSEIESDEE